MKRKKQPFTSREWSRGGSLHDLAEQELHWNLGSDITAVKIALSDCLFTLLSVCLSFLKLDISSVQTQLEI